MSNIIAPGGSATISLAASDKIAIFSMGDCVLNSLVDTVSFPPRNALVANVPGGAEYVSSAVSAASTYVIDNSGNPYPCLYEVGTAAVVKQARRERGLSSTPQALDLTGAITASMILGDIVTSAAAAVTGTLPTGAVLAAASDWAVGEHYDWTIIKVGANTFTVDPATDHTIVGLLTVATATAARFRTKQTAAGVFVTYRLAV